MTEKAETRFPCPCCGFLVHELGVGMYEVCPICRWEDDLVQLRWPALAGGANKLSLIQSQLNHSRFGVSDPSRAADAREPLAGEVQDRDFHPIGEADGPFENVDEFAADWPADRTRLYWWRAGFWRGGIAS